MPPLRRRSTRRLRWVYLLLAATLALLPLAPLRHSAVHAQAAAPAPTMSVFATGLNNPRGLAFGPHGNLYVAEGGTGGATSTVGQCPQVPPPVGPYTGGFTARISRIGRDGMRTTVVDGLPSSQTSPALGSLVSGVSAVAFQGHTLYALLAGAGCSHGLAGTANAVIRVGEDGSVSQVADLSAYVAAHPVANPDAADFEPDGTWYSLVAARGSLYAVEPNHQELDQITRQGAIHRVLDFSVLYPGNTDWQGPTGLTFYHGAFYVGYLTPFPLVVGAASIARVTPDGAISTVATGLTAVVGVAVHDGQLYALEMSTAPGNPTPGTGAVVRVSGAGTLDTVASGLTFPTAMTFGPDGALYVSNYGFGSAAGAGQIVRITVPSSGQHGDQEGDQEGD